MLVQQFPSNVVIEPAALDFQGMLLMRMRSFALMHKDLCVARTPLLFALWCGCIVRKRTNAPFQIERLG